MTVSDWKVDRDDLGHNVTLQIKVDTDSFLSRELKSRFGKNNPTVLLLCQTGHRFFLFITN